MVLVWKYLSKFKLLPPSEKSEPQRMHHQSEFSKEQAEPLFLLPGCGVRGWTGCTDINRRVDSFSVSVSRAVIYILYLPHPACYFVLPPHAL